LGRTGLSGKELNRVEVMGRVKAGSLGLAEAAELMGVSYRQAKRILARYRRGGAKALQHGHCGRASNRGYGARFRTAVLKRYGERYSDFGPTLAAEHLGEDDGLAVSAETLRRWLREAGQTPMRRRKPYRQRREPKAHFGELVQLDGSFHRWLEDRAGENCLMHLVDDATSTALFEFSPDRQETTWSAVHVLRRWIERYGVPRALYTDWKSVYVRQPSEREQREGTVARTQFGCMCERLGIRIIAAGSPQAKGRVERAHGTHQDRLVKKLRLAGIGGYEQAQRYLDERYVAEHNRRYVRPAASETDYHRRTPTARQLDEVFWLEEERVVSQDWVVSYQGRLLQLARQSRHYAPAKSRVTVRENQAGEIAVRYRGHKLSYREIARRPEPPPAARDALSPARRGQSIPPLSHPWKRTYKELPTVASAY
jgi:transposase